MNVVHRKDEFDPPRPGPAAPAARNTGEQDGAPRRRRRWLPALIVVALAAGLGAYVYQTRFTEPEPPAVAIETGPRVMRLNSLEVMTIAAADQSETVTLTGSLSPVRQAVVSTRVGGMMRSIAVRPGDTVTEGQVIAEIDPAELELQVQQQLGAIEATQAQLRLAESQLASTETLVERGSSPRAALTQAQSNVEGLVANLHSQRQQLASLELNLAHATIHAPFAGTVSERSAEPGQTVSAGAPVVTLVDTSRIEVRATASLADAGRIAIGQEVAIRVEGLPGRTFSGTVDRISPVAVEGTRSLPIYITLDNPDGILRGGMFVTGEVVVAAAEAVITVPARALREDDEGPHVLVVEDDVLVRRDVTPGRAWAGGRTIEVAAGLSPGERVVSQQLVELEPGMSVAVEGGD